MRNPFSMLLNVSNGQTVPKSDRLSTSGMFSLLVVSHVADGPDARLH